jgi:hypothetical protein
VARRAARTRRIARWSGSDRLRRRGRAPPRRGPGLSVLLHAGRARRRASTPRRRPASRRATSAGAPADRGRAGRVRGRGPPRPRSASGSARAWSPSTTSSAAAWRSTPRTSAGTSSSSAATARRSTTSPSSWTTQRWRSPTSSAARTTSVEHAQAHPAVPGARPPIPRLRAPAAHPQPGPDEDEQAQEPDGGRDYIAQGFIREALVNYLALLGWATGRRTRSSRSTRSSSASTSTRSRRAAPSSTASVSSGSTASGSAASTPTSSSTGCARSSRRSTSRADRPDARRTRRSGRSCPSSRSACPRSARSATSSASCGSTEVGLDPRDARAEALGPGHDRRGAAAARDVIAALRRGDVRGGRARAAAPRACRGARLEGRGPVHGDPRRGHRRTATPPLFDTLVALGRERVLARLDAAEAAVAALASGTPAG